MARPARTPSAKASARRRSALGGSSSVPISINKSRCSPTARLLRWRRHRKAKGLAPRVIRGRDGERVRTHTQDVTLTLGHRDRAARIEQVKCVRGLEHHFVRGQRQTGLDELVALSLTSIKPTKQHNKNNKNKKKRQQHDHKQKKHVAVRDLARGTVRPHE